VATSSPKGYEMNSVIRSPKDFWLGMIYAVVGAAGFWFARELPFGSGARMGAGYFPTVISSLLFLFGLVSLGRAFVLTGEAIGAIAWKALPLIIGSVVVFAILIDNAGMVVAGVALLVLSASASAKFRFQWLPFAGAIALSAGCALLFISGLGLPIPVVGPWLRAILPMAAG
jgi:hypothetical protein